MSSRHERLGELLDRALRLGPSERDLFLEEISREEPSLRDELEELIRHSERPPEFLKTGAFADDTIAETEELPDRIGPYRILEKIGEGGMGIVYRAEQRSPIRRTVAIKVIRLGIATREVIARFNSERQALALMNHRNVAGVIDVGSTEQGLPYFVMEFVDGEPVTDYCDRHRLSVRARLELFMQVCEGVQHAHQNAIIHRDIKPSNVLITVQDGRAIPKIIDFGIAKALDHRLSMHSPATLGGQLLGTPEYMSPEQAEVNSHRVDTRTDVYSLGVLLYELLAGARPFEPRGQARSRDEIRTSIREDEPARPSSSVRAPGALSAAANRGTDVRSLSRRLSGDLDWITLKALEKDPELRYGSPSELAADIGRHLRVEPVVAGPPSATYRMGKFVRRHRTGVGFAATLLITLLVFAITASIQAGRIDRESERAAEEAATAEAVTEFLVQGLFDLPSRIGPRMEQSTGRELLESGTEKVLNRLADRPLLQARLLHTMGDVHRRIGLPRRARYLLEEAHARLAELRGADDPMTLLCARSLARVYMETGEGERSEELYREILDERRLALGSAHADTLRSMNDLAYLYKSTSRHEEAAVLFEETVAGLRRVLGERDPETLISAGFLAGVYLEQDRHAELEPLLLRLAATMPEVLGDGHAETQAAFYNLACLYAKRGDRERALRYLSDAVDRGFGSGVLIAADRHMAFLRGDAEFTALARKGSQNASRTWRSLVKAGECAYSQGRHDEAESRFRDALEGVRRRPRGRHLVEAHGVMDWLLYLYLTQGRYEEAEPLAREWLDAVEPDSGEYAHAQWYLAVSHSGMGEVDEAVFLIERVLEGPLGIVAHDYLSAQRSALLGDREGALRALGKTAVEGTPEGWWEYPSWDPAFDTLRGDSEFEAMVVAIAGQQRAY